MKILDYITLVSTTEKKLPRGIEKFAADIEADVYAVERDGVLVIFESEKISEKLKDKFSMYALGSYDRGLIEGAETKEELIKDYAALMAKGVLDITRMSSNLEENIKKELDKIKAEKENLNNNTL